MKNVKTIFLITLIFASLSTTASAGHNHFHSGPHGGYHFSSYHHRGHHYGSGFWGSYGLGLLTGSIITSIITPPPPRTIVYRHSAPPPVVIYREATPIPRISYTKTVVTEPAVQNDFILRTVKTEPELLNMRYTPDLGAAVVEQIPRDTTMYVLGAAADWLYVKTRDNHYGWIMTKYTHESEQPVG